LSLGAMQGQASPAKVYNCCEFVPTADKGACDLLVGGSNGVVYGYRRAACFQTANVIRGGVMHMSLAGDHIVCGGAMGSIKVIDSRSLATVLAVSASEFVGGAPSRGMSRASGRGTNTPRPGSAAQGTQGGAKTVLSKPPVSVLAAAAARESGGAADPSDITGLTVVMGPRGKADYVIATTAAGRAVRVDLAAALRQASSSSSSSQLGKAGGGAISSASEAGAGTDSGIAITPLFYFHTGELWGLTAGSFSGSRHRFGTRVLLASSGDDRKLCVWDAAGRTLMAKATTTAAARCCHFDRTCSFLAVGTQAGTVHIYALLAADGGVGRDKAARTSAAGGAVGKGEAMSSAARAAGEGKALSRLSFQLQELVFRKDFREGVTDIKFSPLDDKLAAGRCVTFSFSLL